MVSLIDFRNDIVKIKILMLGSAGRRGADGHEVAGHHLVGSV